MKGDFLKGLATFPPTRNSLTILRNMKSCNQQLRTNLFHSWGLYDNRKAENETFK